MKRFPVFETRMSFIDPYQHIIVSHLLFIYTFYGRKVGVLLGLNIAGVDCKVKLYDKPLDFFFFFNELNVVQIGYKSR